MLGSCCEEQEAQEAAVRARIRAATRMSEERLFELGWGYRAPRFVALCAELQQRGGDDWLDGLREGKGGWEGARASLTELTGKLDALCLCAVRSQVK